MSFCYCFLGGLLKKRDGVFPSLYVIKEEISIQFKPIANSEHDCLLMGVLQDSLACIRTGELGERQAIIAFKVQIIQFISDAANNVRSALAQMFLNVS